MKLSPAQQQTIKFFLEPYVEQITESYESQPDYARVALLIAMSGRNDNLLASDIKKITAKIEVIHATQYIGKLFNGEHGLRNELTRLGSGQAPNDATIQEYAKEILPRMFLNSYQLLATFKQNRNIRMRIYVVAYCLSMHEGNWHNDKALLRNELVDLIHHLKSELRIKNTPLPNDDDTGGYSPANLSNLDLSHMQLPCCQVKHFNLQGCNLEGINFSGSHVNAFHINGNKNIRGLACSGVFYGQNLQSIYDPFAKKANNNPNAVCLYETASGQNFGIANNLDTIPHDGSLNSLNDSGSFINSHELTDTQRPQVTTTTTTTTTRSTESGTKSGNANATLSIQEQQPITQVMPLPNQDSLLLEEISALRNEVHELREQLAAQRREQQQQINNNNNNSNSNNSNSNNKIVNDNEFVNDPSPPQRGRTTFHRRNFGDHPREIRAQQKAKKAAERQTRYQALNDLSLLGNHQQRQQQEISHMQNNSNHANTRSQSRHQNRKHDGSCKIV